MDIAKFIRTSIGTDWPETRETFVSRFANKVFDSLKANPGYDAKMHLVTEWLIEFDSNGGPGREVGLDAKGNVVIAGPDSENYGFWHDTNMKLEDFSGEQIAKVDFERYWELAEKRGILNGSN